MKATTSEFVQVFGPPGMSAFALLLGDKRTSSAPANFLMSTRGSLPLLGPDNGRAVEPAS
jgi:hypothetical protein